MRQCNRTQPIAVAKLAIGLRQQRAALVALRNQQPAELRGSYDEEIGEIDKRLRTPRALAVTPQDRTYERVRSGCGDAPPRDFSEIAPQRPLRRRTPRARPAARRPSCRPRRSRPTRAGPRSDSDDGPPRPAALDEGVAR